MNITSVGEKISSALVEKAIAESAIHLRKVAKAPILAQPETEHIVTDEMAEEISKITDAAMLKLEHDLRADCRNIAQREITEAFQTVLKKHDEFQLRIAALMAEFSKTRNRVQSELVKLPEKNRGPHLTRLDAMEKKYGDDILQMLAKHQGEMIRIVFSPYGLREETLSEILTSLDLQQT